MLTKKVAVEPVKGLAIHIHDRGAMLIPEAYAGASRPGDRASFEKLGNNDLLLVCHDGLLAV